ncbi:hypothetical protein [Conyzicola sp.]|uniref:hypothetical protein n=1 Tax=Conyzicola sp. TaxID=1969404 RepID=UPI003988E9BB
MKPWLRRNWIGLVAVAVLLPATVGITFATEWTQYFGGRASAPVTVDAGDTAEFAQARWSVDSTQRISASSAEGEKIGLPAGSDLVVVTVRVSPAGDAEPPGCQVQLEEFDGGSVSRSWDDAATDPIDYDPSEGTASICPTDAVAPYVLESTFVVASDASDDLALAVTVPSELPRYLSFRL